MRMRPTSFRRIYEPAQISFGIPRCHPNEECWNAGMPEWNVGMPECRNAALVTCFAFSICTRTPSSPLVDSSNSSNSSSHLLAYDRTTCRSLITGPLRCCLPWCSWLLSLLRSTLPPRNTCLPRHLPPTCLRRRRPMLPP